MATIIFSNGQKVNFNGNPSPQDVEEVAMKLGIKPEQPIQPGKFSIENPALGMNVAREALDIGTGLIRQTAKIPVQQIRTGLGSLAMLPTDIQSYRTGAPPQQTQARQFGESLLKPTNFSLLGNIKGLSAVPSDVQKYGTQTPLETLGQSATSFLEVGAPGLGKLVKRPLTRVAEALYQSALKPGLEALGKGVVQTGLKERVWLTKGGVERAAQKIDTLEESLGNLIESGKTAGKKVELSGMKEFVDPIRKWFETVDIKASKDAQSYIDRTLKNFSAKYGKQVPIEEAQKLKVNTMRLLRSAYGELSNVEKETQKGMARFLKEGIVKVTPEVGDINKRLSNLYALDDALEKASKRIGNLNLLGLGTKLGAAAGGKAGAVLGIISDFMDKAAVKSGAAIGINELTNLSSKAANAGKIPIVELLNYIHKNYGMDKER